MLWDITDPLMPVEVGESEFRVHNAGDSDYDLENFSVCDDCRWGVANFKGGTVLFDLGEGDAPAFVDSVLNEDADVVPGAFTFTVPDATGQFLVASNLTDDCVTNDSSLYVFGGIDVENDLVFSSCVEAEGVSWTQIVGGVGPVPSGDDSRPYLYLGDKSQRVFLFQMFEGGPGYGPHLEYLSTPMVSYMSR